jgi:hypothetical protein
MTLRDTLLEILDILSESRRTSLRPTIQTEGLSDEDLASRVKVLAERRMEQLHWLTDHQVH